MDTTTAIGGFAAVCTTASYIPQLKKCWETGEAGDLPLKMFLILTAGIASWVVFTACCVKTGSLSLPTA